MVSVLVIILNWNCAKDSVEAVESVMGSELGGYTADIFLVDNGSEDDSVDYLHNYFKTKQYNVIMVKTPKQKFEKGSKRIFFYISEKNLGFTGGNNIGFEFALTNNYDFVFLLNADAQLAAKDTLKVLLKHIIADEKIACVGPKVCLPSSKQNEEVIFRGGYVDFWRASAGTIFWEVRDEVREVDYIEGSAMLIRTEVLRKIGLFDERFFTYWEDTDWCTRAKKRGYKIVYVPKAKCYHKASRDGKSTYDFYQYTPEKIYYTFRNRLLFIQKHARAIHKLTCIPITFYSTFAQFFLRTIRLRNYKNFIGNASAIYMALRDYIKLRG